MTVSDTLPETAILWTRTAVLVMAMATAVWGQEADRLVERLAQEGWLAARALAPLGAPRDRLGPVNDALRQLDRHLADPAARYADAAIRAGLAAAQEERDELAVYLAHAGDLARQMELTGGVARWPLPIDELEGELWFEVDRFAEARDAFRRATVVFSGSRAWLGLARASDRLGDTAAACAAYRSAMTTRLSESEQQEVEAYAGRC